MIDNGNHWALSPAYDLLNVAIINPDDTEELALTLEGKKRKIKIEHFIRLGEGLGLNKKQVDGVFKRFIRKQSEAFLWLDKSFLSVEYQEKYKSLLNEKYARLF